MNSYVVIESGYIDYEGLSSRTIVGVFSTAEKAHTTLQDSDSYGHYKYNRKSKIYEDFSCQVYGFVYKVEVKEYCLDGDIE